MCELVKYISSFADRFPEPVEPDLWVGWVWRTERLHLPGQVHKDGRRRAREVVGGYKLTFPKLLDSPAAHLDQAAGDHAAEPNQDGQRSIHACQRTTPACLLPAHKVGALKACAVATPRR